MRESQAKTQRASEAQVVLLSQCSAAERAGLLAAYDREVYRPAFPDDHLREDVAAWAALLDGDPGPPRPRLEVLLLVAGDGAVVGGATVEHYRTAHCGLLTYLAVAQGQRGRGLGRRLFDAARSALKEMAGPDTILFAETEIREGRKDRARRSETIRRHRQLARLGMRRLDFAYHMPPLRPGLGTRRLHLLVHDREEGATVAASLVRAFVAELAASLDADPAADEATRKMMSALEGDGAVCVKSLPDTDCERRFDEAPVFTQLDSTSFSFAFEIAFEPIGPERQAPRQAFRLARAYALIEDDPETFKALVEPLRSFHDDVTMGEPGRNGRPLIFQASAGRLEDEARRVFMVRPGRWRYCAEGQTTELVSAQGQPAAFGMHFQDMFCAFQSGRLFYVLTLTQPPQGAEPLDEYAILQLEQLALDPGEHAGDPDFLAFAWPAGPDAGAPLSLIGLAETRLRALEAMKDGPGAFPSVIRGMELQRAGERRTPLSPAYLRSLCVAIDDGPLAALVSAAAAAESGDALLDPEAPAPPLQSASGPCPHIDFGGKSGLRRFAALAGLVQGVPDFPFQDASEIHDSTRPTSQSIKAALFAHPRFTIEIGADWRSRDAARPCLGTCPYLLLMWIVAVHDEMIVGEMEERIEGMIFASGDTASRATPLADVDKVLRGAGNWFSPGSYAPLQTNLRARVDLFRWLSINRSDHLFRYPTERGALARIQEAMGTIERFSHAHEMVDRMESLVEDVSELKRSYADRRTNIILLVIAILSLVGLLSELGLDMAIF